MSDNQGRIETFGQFWPYYLLEHRNPTCRALHFVGTTGFFSFLAYAAWSDPRTTLVTLAVLVALSLLEARFLEGRVHGLLVLGCLVGWVGFSGPVQFVYGIVFAYLFAWVGHFIIERNRPATFTYPVWSLWGDMRLWARMARGQLWTGDTADVVSVPPAVEQPAA